VFLDYFNLSSLDDLPSLAEIRDMGSLEPELDLEPAGDGTDGDDSIPENAAQDSGDAVPEESDDWVPEDDQNDNEETAPPQTGH